MTEKEFEDLRFNRPWLTGLGLHEVPWRDIRAGRVKGNTTRAIDLAIQQLFDNGSTVLLDPWEFGGHAKANADFQRRVFKRLQNEHNMPVYSDHPKQSTRNRYCIVRSNRLTLVTPK